MSPLRPVLLRTAALAAVVSLLAALPVSGAAARPTGPIAHEAVAPLAVPVATFILKELAVGVLNKAGGEAFGAAMAEAGFGDPNVARLKAVDEKLARIEVSLNELHAKVDSITTSLAYSRLSAVRHSISSIAGYVGEARTRLQQLTNGSITVASVRQQKRAELLDLIKTKILHEQTRVMTAIYDATGNDDILKSSFRAELTKGRFWSEANWDQAMQVVGYYRDLAAEVLYFRVEYEYSSITSSSTPEEIAQRKALVQQTVDNFNTASGKFNQQTPTRFGAANDAVTVDTRPSADGRHLVWLTDSRFRYHIPTNDKVAENQYVDLLPTLGEFRNLVSGRGSQTPPNYLRAQGFTLPLTCDSYAPWYKPPGAGALTTQGVHWTRDISNGRRWAWGSHDDGQGLLNAACDFIRVRHLFPWERPWWGESWR